MTNNALIGRRIRAARKAAGMSQEELGEWLGCSGPRVSDLERGAPAGSALRADEVASLVDMFGIEAGYWVGAETQGTKEQTRIVNKSGVSVSVYRRAQRGEWELVKTYPAEGGEQPRYHNKWQTIGEAEGIELREHRLEASNIPQPEPGVIYIVHPYVAQALPERTDFVAAEFRTSSVRGDDGRAFGIEYFTCYNRP